MSTLWTKLTVSIATAILFIQCLYVFRPRSGLQRIKMADKNHIRVSHPSHPLPKPDDAKVLARRVSDYCRHYMVERNGRKPHEILRIMTLFDQNITFLDVGAHRGVTSLPVLFCMRSKHRVISIEPVLNNYDTILREKHLLDGSSQPGGRFSLHNLALSDESANRHIYFPGHRPDNAALAQAASTVVFNTGNRAQSVRLDTGDALLARERAQPKVIKIDVQGSELRVVKGLRKYLTTHSDILVLAEQDARLMIKSGFEPEAVLDYMTKLGFKSYCKPVVQVRRGQLFINSPAFGREQIGRVTCSDIAYWKPAANIGK